MDEHAATREAESEAALSRIPNPGSWGICVAEGNSATSGGGIRAFFWFETADELLTFVSHHIAWLDRQPERIDFTPVHARIQHALVPFFDGTEPIGLLPSALSRELEGITQIEWAGAFSDLLSGDSDLCRGWRDRSRGGRGDDTPIRPEELDTFLDSISFPIS